MGFIDWLFESIEVTRKLTNSYYIIIAIITLIAIFLLFKMRFKRFSFNLWLISGLICLGWELYLFFTGARQYNFPPALELPYHALTEAGPGLIIMILFAHKIKIINISEYSDDYKPKKRSTGKEPVRAGKMEKSVKPEKMDQAEKTETISISKDEDMNFEDNEE
jgi:multisubunit Na+/H+ antiporter MnhC subunit